MTCKDDPSPIANSGPPCQCGRKARYFGMFAGGVCLQHAMAMLDMFPDGLSQFWPEYREDLADRLRARNAREGPK